MAKPAVAATVRGFWYGFKQPFVGMRVLLFRYPRLLVYWLPVLAITLSLLVGAAVWSFSYAPGLAAWMWTPPAGDETSASVGRGVHWVLSAVLTVFVFFLSVIFAYLLSNLLAAPFKDLLSEALERAMSGAPATPLSLRAITLDMWRSLLMEAAKLGLYLLVMGPLLLASFLIPVVGQIAYFVVGALLTAAYFGIDYVDWPVARRGFGVRARVRLFRAHSATLLGFGFGVWLLLFVPLLNLLFMVAAVAGGTLLVLDLEREGKLLKPHFGA